MDNFNYQAYLKSGKIYGDKQEVISESKEVTERKKQGYDDREDESLGARRGAEKDKKQSFKDRRDDSYGKFGKRDAEAKGKDKGPGKNKVNKENVEEVGKGYFKKEHGVGKKGFSMDKRKELQETIQEAYTKIQEGSYPFDQCLDDNEGKYGVEGAKRVCGAIRAAYGEGLVKEDYDSLVGKLKKQGKSAKAAKAIAGAMASYKAKGGGKGPTAKQAKRAK